MSTSLILELWGLRSVVDRDVVSQREGVEVLVVEEEEDLVLATGGAHARMEPAVTALQAAREEAREAKAMRESGARPPRAGVMGRHHTGAAALQEVAVTSTQWIPGTAGVEGETAVPAPKSMKRKRKRKKDEGVTGTKEKRGRRRREEEKTAG